MSNKDLIKQYVQTVKELHEYQFNKLNDNQKKTYLKQLIPKLKEDYVSLRYFVYDYMDENLKNELAEFFIEDRKIINNRTLNGLVSDKSDALFDFIKRLIVIGDEIRHEHAYVTIGLDILRYYVMDLDSKHYVKFLEYILKKVKNLPYNGWIDIVDAAPDLNISVNVLVKYYLGHGGELGSNELAALTMYNYNPMVLVDLLGEEEYHRIITKDKLMAGLAFKRWANAAWDGLEATNIINKFNLE